MQHKIHKTHGDLLHPIFLIYFRTSECETLLQFSITEEIRYEPIKTSQDTRADRQTPSTYFSFHATALPRDINPYWPLFC